jgi:serine/threonine-protein kinase
MREVEAVTRLQSAYVPTVYDHGLRDVGGRDRLYIVEEFIAGRSYRDVLQAGEADMEMVLRLGKALLSACADFEAADLVHRDIKPENIMIGDDGKVWVIDFGIVRLLDEESLTATGANFGPCTLGYGAPEQLKNVKPQINVRADLFSVGIVLYESISGGHPYRRPGLHQLDVVREMQRKDPPMLSGGVDDDLARFIAAMTSRFPSRRPQTSAKAIGWFQPICDRIMRELQ